MKNMLSSIEYKNEKFNWVVRLAIYLLLTTGLMTAMLLLLMGINAATFNNTMIDMLLSSISMIVAPILVIKIMENSLPMERLGLAREGVVKKYVVGFLIGFVLIFASALPVMILFSKSVQVTSPIPYKVIILYFLFFIVQGAGEEVLVRGLIFPVIVKNSRPIVALILTSGFFSVLHLLNPGVNLISVLNLFLAGMLFGYCVLYFDSLWQACALHTAWNFIQGNVLGFKISGIDVQSLISVETKGKELFTGGSFGVEGSIFSVIVLVIVVVVLHVLCNKKGINVLSKSV